MRENMKDPHVGRERLMEREGRTMRKAKSVRSGCVRPVFVAGELVVLRWIFEFDWQDGTHTRLEELAYQRWEGERIAQEQFFYDPAQLAPRPA